MVKPAGTGIDDTDRSFARAAVGAPETAAEDLDRETEGYGSAVERSLPAAAVSEGENGEGHRGKVVQRVDGGVHCLSAGRGGLGS